jgi:ADP-glucose pyrophosphorylase
LEASKKFLRADENNKSSANDFGKNIIPNMLEMGVKMYAYSFKGYWKDVGTIDSLWEANMDLLREDNELNLGDPDWRIYSVNNVEPAQYIGPNANIKSSIAVDGCEIYGEVNHSIIFSGCVIGKNSKIIDSVIMPNTKIGDNVIINKAVVGSNVTVRRNSIIGDGKQITVVGSNVDVKSGSIFVNV